VRSAIRSASSSAAPTTTRPAAHRNIADQREGAENGLKLRGPRSRDDAQAIDAGQQPGIQTVGSRAEIENDGRSIADGVDDLEEAIDVQPSAQSWRAGQERHG